MGLNSLDIAMLSIHSCPVGQLGTKDTGGMSVYIRETAKILGEQGHRVDIFTRDHDADHPKIMHLSKNVRLVHLMAGDREDLRKLSVYPHVKAYAQELDDFCKQNSISYDIIHSHYWLSGLVGKYLRSWWDIPHMIMFHTLGAVKNQLNVGNFEPKLRLFNEKDLARHCHKIIAPTQMEKKHILDYFDADEEKIRTIPCGVNPDIFFPMEKQKARQHLNFGKNHRIILYVGRIEPLKGLDRILCAVARLNDKMPVKLVIVGGDQHNTPEMKEILDRIKQLKIENAVTFSGRVDQEDLFLYYNAADVLAVASLYESFGLVALEALACGTPVVSTSVGGMKTLIQPGKNGFLVHDLSIDGMAKALNQVLDNRKYFESHSLDIRQSIKHLSWDTIGRALLEEYRCLVALQNQEQWAS